jgi:hypothetical protein
MKPRGVVWRAGVLVLLLLPTLVACETKPKKNSESRPPVTRMRDDPFPQESRLEFLRADVEGYVTGIQQSPNRFFAVAASGDSVYAGGANGLYAYANGAFDQVLADAPIYALLANGDTLYAGTDSAVLVLRGDQQSRLEAAEAGPVRAFALADNTLYAGTDRGLYILQGDSFAVYGEPITRRVSDLLAEESGVLWVASEDGLYRIDDGDVRRWTDRDYLLRIQVTGLAFDDQGDLWIATMGGLNEMYPDGTVVAYTGAQGLPMLALTAVVYQPDGDAAGLWIGSSRGAIRRTEEAWNFYRGRRWVPDDQINDAALDGAGNVWLATGNGVSRITFNSWTLAEKADRYLELNEARHNRYGLASSCALDLPGELGTFRLQDDDNDGLWTGMYLAALSFEYAVTGDPKIKELADEHFAAMALLEQVTGIPGLPARSIAPLYTYSQNPDCYPDCQWRANEELGWDWKSDTSSDEITGHFYAYAAYYDLVADGERKPQVIELVWRIANYLLSNDYFLIDWDGEPTTWGVWNPTYLWEWYKLPPDEAGQYLGLIYPNSLEILSFMRTAYHVTGDARFEDAYQDLINNYALADLALDAAIYFPLITNHSTDELLFLAYYPLLRYETDTVLRAKYLDGLRRTWGFNRIEQSSFFDITFGALSLGQEDFDLPAAMDNLREIPLDLVEWTMKNSDRQDIELDPLPNRFGEVISATDMPPLPPDERPVMIWNGDPFVLDGGAAGFREEAGTFWLLPYWMGRYHQFIVE